MRNGWEGKFAFSLNLKSLWFHFASARASAWHWHEFPLTLKLRLCVIKQGSLVNKTWTRWLCEVAAAFALPLAWPSVAAFFMVFSQVPSSWTSSHRRGQSHGENRDFRLTLMHLCGTVWKFSGLKSGAFWCVNDDFGATAKCAHRCFPVNCLPRGANKPY